MHEVYNSEVLRGHGNKESKLKLNARRCVSLVKLWVETVWTQSTLDMFSHIKIQVLLILALYSKGLNVSILTRVLKVSELRHQSRTTISQKILHALSVN